MNVISLAHEYVQNQQESSWNDDPFDLKGTFAGAANMSHQRNLNDYAESLVSQYGNYVGDQYELTLDMLPEDEQNELVRLYIESIDREIEWACYGADESINSDYLCAMLAMLKDDCKETREHYAEVTRKNLLTYYKKSLECLLNEACDSFLHNSMNEQGYYSGRDMDHGDLVWRKI